MYLVKELYPMQRIALLELVVGITRERDRRSLERVLIETLYNSLDAHAVIFLHTSPGGDSDLLSESASLPTDACQQRLKTVAGDEDKQKVVPDCGMARSLSEGVDLLDELGDNSLRYLFPIQGRKGISGLLVVYCRCCDNQSSQFIRAFLDIYSNFLEIIDDNEHDTLTGLLNRKTFDSHISELLLTTLPEKKSNGIRISDKQGPNDSGEAVSHWIGILDIDHFKRVNDTFGHVYGDEVLLLFSELMRKTFRSSDILFRYGGEEFVVVLSSATEAISLQAFNRFRKCVEEFDFPQVGRVTVSIGIVQIQAEDHPSTVIENADQALYYAKEHGRNRVCGYNQLIADGALTKRGSQSEVELF